MAFNLRSQDILNSNLGTLWLVTPEGTQRKMADVRNITASVEVATEEFRCIGEMMHRHKGVGMRGSGTMTLYTGTREFSEYLEKFKNHMVNYRFEIYSEMKDPESPAGGNFGRGARVVILRDVLLHGTQLFKLDTEDGILDYDVDFDFDDFQILQDFDPAESLKLKEGGAAAVGNFTSNLVNIAVSD
jgi:hypothetical protein